jgi:integrase
MRVLTVPEIHALFEACRGDELEALYVLALTTGMRQGELLALRWRDIDLERGWLDVNATLVRVAGRPRRSPPKTDSSRRSIKLTARAISALRSHRLRMAERLMPLRARPDGDVYVFLDGGEPLNGAHITERAFKPLLKRAGLPAIRFHDLRHCCASLLLSQGVRVDLVAQMLGHSTPAMTLQIYAHLMPGDQEEAIARLDRVLGGIA